MSCTAFCSRRAVSSLALVSVFVNIIGWGQTITSTMVGQVNDPTGAGVAEAKVSVKNVETGITSEGLSDSSGTYSSRSFNPEATISPSASLVSSPMQ